MDGNIVAEYKYKTGTVRICDAAFAAASESELERRKAEARKVAYRILEQSTERKKTSCL